MSTFPLFTATILYGHHDTSVCGHFTYSRRKINSLEFIATSHQQQCLLVLWCLSNSNPKQYILETRKGNVGGFVVTLGHLLGWVEILVKLYYPRMKRPFIMECQYNVLMLPFCGRQQLRWEYEWNLEDYYRSCILYVHMKRRRVNRRA